MKSFTDERHPETNDEVWILEHESVYTYGVSTDPKKIPTHLSHPALRSDRGGKITYHGPGQLVVYILMDFNRASMKPKEFIVKFQSAIHQTVKSYCKDAVLNEDEDGIFLENLKLASFGLKITRKGSYHGAAINHSMNLDAWKTQVGRRNRKKSIAGVLESDTHSLLKAESKSEIKSSGSSRPT